MNALGKQLAVAGMLVAGAAQALPEVVCRVEMDRDVVFAGQRQTAVVKVTLDAPVVPRREERPPVNLGIVLDRSGSMAGDKIEKARDAAIAALRRLGAQDTFSLVTYSDRIETVVPAQSASNTAWIEQKIRAITTGGNTALFAGVGQGASEVRKNLSRDSVHRLLLLSDGKANSGPSSPEELGRLGTALRKEGISVSTIGVGTDYNEDLMTLMAQNSDGNTYFVESSADLPHIFSKELGDVLSVVASRVVIEVEFPAGIRPIRIIGRDGRVGANTVQVSLNQLYGGQEKYALIEVELPESAEGEVRKVADARCTYQDMLANRSNTTSGQAMVRFSKKPEEVEQSVNIAVGKEVMLNRAVELQAQAIIQADNRDYDQAAETMGRNSAVLMDYADRYNVPELKEEAETYQRQAEEIKLKKVLSPTQRKEMKTRNYEIQNQQQSSLPQKEKKD